GNPDPKNGEQQALKTDEWLETVGEIRGGFGWEADPRSTDPVDQAVIRKRARNGPGKHGKVEHETTGAVGTDPEVTTIRPGPQAGVGGRLIFGQGSAQLDADLKHALNQIAQQIRGHRNVVLIKGHASRDDFADGGSPEK